MFENLFLLLSKDQTTGIIIEFTIKLLVDYDVIQV